MDEYTIRFLSALVKGLSSGTIKVIYFDIQPEIENDIIIARNLKREGKYEHSIGVYASIINRCGCLYTEVGRMLAKTLCAMNEYSGAIFLLKNCASAKWEDDVSAPRTGNPAYDEYLRLSMNSMPTSSAADFYELRDCMVEAAKGNLMPLFKRTKEVSGNDNYRNVKTNFEIIQECRNFCEKAKLL